MRERVVLFGTGVELVGVLTEPDRTQVKPSAPAVVLLNAGLLHKVGASRLHVTVARALADEGVSVLRFDLAGIGDSEPRRDVMSFEASAIADIRDALDYLTTRVESRGFVLFGLCSGSDMAFAEAQNDPRVVGLVQLDAYAYRTWKWHLHHYGPRLAKPTSWWHFVDRGARRAVGGDVKPAADGVALSPYARAFPPKAEVQAGLERLLSRGVRFLNIFSGGQRDHYNYARQHQDAFSDIDFDGRVRVEYLPGADHIFTGLDHQRQIVETVREWLEGFGHEGTAEPVRSKARGRRFDVRRLSRLGRFGADHAPAPNVDAASRP